MKDVIDRLRALPPDLPHPPDRFEQIRSRVAVRRRRRLLGSAVMVVCAVAGVVFATSLVRGWSDSAAPGIATEVHPPSQTQTVPECDNGSVLRRVGLGQSTVALNARGLTLGLSKPGSVAYMRTSDFCSSADATNPTQGVRMTKRRVNAQGEIWIPLFTKDGITRVGKVLVGRVN